MTKNNHIEEHTLSCFALNDPTQSSEERETIVSHLRECEGCRSLFEEMSSFYGDVTEELQKNRTLGKRKKKGLLRHSPLPAVWSEPISKIVPRRSVPLIVHMWFYSKRHPLAATGSIGFFALLLYGLFHFVLVPAIDTNPYAYKLNDADKLLRIVNKGNAVLWQKPWYANGNIQDWENMSQVITTVIVDLDRDGKNEVVTIIPKLEEKESKGNIVHAYTSDGELLWKKSYGVAPEFRGQKYGKDFMAKDITFRSVENTVEIFLMLVHDHSPSIIYRLDHSGNIIGSYWHFGHFTGIQILDEDGDGVEELVACGINDVIDRATITVLDPEKIVGEKEATPTTGFGKDISDAEKFYLIIDSEPDDKVQRTAFIPSGRLRNSQLNFRLYTKHGWVFNFSFETGMRLQSVNENDEARRVYGDRLQEVKQQFIENLKIWDGKKFVKRDAVTMK